MDLNKALSAHQIALFIARPTRRAMNSANTCAKSLIISPITSRSGRTIGARPAPTCCLPTSSDPSSRLPLRPDWLGWPR